MNVKKRKLFSPWDLLIIGIIAAAAVFFTVFLFFQGETSNAVACIKINGEVYREVSLSQTDEAQDIELENGGHHAVIHIENAKVSFLSSDCPDKLCVNQGTISKNGESIVCLPGRFSVSIISEQDNGLDAVVH